MRRKGFTILELMICMLIFSLILTGVATAISKVGQLTKCSHVDISTRASQNKLFNGFNISVHSLLSIKDKDYESVTKAGIVVENIISEDDITLDGVPYKRVRANKITLYTKGDTQKRILEFKQDAIQDRAPVQLSGVLYDDSFRFTYDSSGQIVGEVLKEEEQTPCIMYSSVGQENHASYFELLIQNDDILARITINYLLPKIDYQIKQARITQACQQEVKVECLA